MFENYYLFDYKKNHVFWKIQANSVLLSYIRFSFETEQYLNVNQRKPNERKTIVQKRGRPISICKYNNLV